MLSTEEQQVRFRESQDDLRDTESFCAHIAELPAQGFPELVVKKYGIKSKSPLCALDISFPVQRLPPDVAHDVLEGAVPYTLSLVIIEFIKDKLLTLDILNCRIESFEFQEKNKPQQIKLGKGSHKVKIRKTAKESWVLLRTLAPIIGDLIPEGDPKWRIHLGLCRVVESIFALDFSEGDIPYLENQIETFPNFV